MEAVAPLPLGLDPGRGLLVLERDAEPLGEPLDRPDEVEVLRLADERDDVAALAAAEAVVELVHRVDGARGVFSSWNGQRPVNREPGRAAKLRPPGDDLDHVGRGDHVAHRQSLIRATG